MVAKIDRFGRIVVPKPLRESLGLRPGDEVELEPSEAGFHVVPRFPEPELIREGRLLVLNCKAEVDPVEWIKREREKRDRTVAGLE